MKVASSKEMISVLLDDLVSKGNNIVLMAQRAQRTLDAQEVSQVSTWVSKGASLVSSLCTKNSPYIQMYNNALASPSFYTIHSNHCAHLGVIKGIIESVKQDYENGILNLDSRITSEVFGDFTEMADYLIEQKLKDPAATILGAVLEDALRKLAVNNDIPLENDKGFAKTIEPLNKDLYTANVYDRQILKQVTSWAETRNNAAHGHFDKFDLDQVKMMRLFVEKFCADYLG